MFTDAADAALALDRPLEDAPLTAVNQNAKFGAVRLEHLYCGYYMNGNAVAPSVSPVDGYAYAENERLLVPTLYATRRPVLPFTPGLPDPPVIEHGQSGGAQPGNLFYWILDARNGQIFSTVSYLKQKQDNDTVTANGTVKVAAWCARTMPAIAQTSPFKHVPYDLFANNQPMRAGPSTGFVDVSHNAKFGAIRCEIIDKGYWGNGNNVPPPVSPIDGYPYTSAEVQFIWWIYTNLAPALPFVNGQLTPPTLGNGLVKRDPEDNGPLETFVVNLEDTTGLITTRFFYHVQGGDSHDYPDGILRVFAVCQRGSTNQWIGSPGANGAQSSTPGGGGGSVIGSIPGPIPAGSTNVAAPDPPIVGVVRSLAGRQDAAYQWTIGVDKPNGAVNWDPVTAFHIQIASDDQFTALNDGPIYQYLYGLSPPATVEFATNFPGEYWIRARVGNQFGFSAFATTSRSTNILDNRTDDTDLMDGPFVALYTNPPSGSAPGIAGNEISVNFEVPIPNSGTFYGYLVILHDQAALPVATRLIEGTNGRIQAGIPRMSDPNANMVPGAWVGRLLIGFSSKRGNPPTWDYEGQILGAYILANTTTEFTFDAEYQNLHRSDQNMRWFVTDQTGQLWAKVAFSQHVTDETITLGTTLDVSTRGRVYKNASAMVPSYAWVACQNVYGYGRVMDPPQQAFYAGLVTKEHRDLNITREKVSGSGAGTGAITVDKTNISALGNMTIQLGTVRTGELRTADAGARIVINSVTGFQAFDAFDSALARIGVSGSDAGYIYGHILRGIIDGLAMYSNDGQGQVYVLSNEVGVWVANSPAATFNTDGVRLYNRNLRMTDGYGVANESLQAAWAFTGAQLISFIAGAEAAQIDGFRAAPNTPLALYIDGALRRVEVGPTDSGGTGYRVLRIANF